MKYELTGDGQIIHRTVHRSETREHLAFVPGHLVVNVKADAFLPFLDEARSTRSLKAFPEKLAAPLRHLQTEWGMRAASAVAGTSAPRGSTQSAIVEALAESAATDSSDLQGLMVIDVAESQNVEALAEELQRAGTFEFVEPFPARWPAAAKVTFRRLSAADPEQNLQWHLRAIDWFAVDRPDCRQVTVAVMDSGIDVTHPQLKPAIRNYEHFGWKPDDLLGHGTHVAGIIAARGRMDVPSIGVTNSRIDVWKVFDDKPVKGEFYVDPDSYLRALRSIETSGAKVVNLSLGGTESSQVEQLLFRRLNDRGISIVAAMGNEYEDGNPVKYPAAYANVVAVGAVDERLRRAAFSNAGRHLTLMAPGTNILSTVPLKRSRHRWETDLAAWEGTSMATPQVCAAVAMLIATAGSMSPEDVTAALCRSAKALPEMKAAHGALHYGHGLLNVRRLLRKKVKRHV
jgi:hypothetical protein